MNIPKLNMFGLLSLDKGFMHYKFYDSAVFSNKLSFPPKVCSESLGQLERERGVFFQNRVIVPLSCVILFFM